MSRSMLGLMLAVCFILSSATISSKIEYGIGIGLSLDYGTASLFYSNGSTVDVVRIEGSQAYKSMMRSPSALKRDVGLDYLSNTESSDLAIEAIQPSIHQASLRDHLPAWLGGTSPKAEPLSIMIHALSTAVESYVSTPTTDLEIVTPFPASSFFFDSLRSACSSLSLRMPMSAQPPGGIVVARTHGIGHNCPDTIAGRPSSYQDQDCNDPGQLILTVDYSRAALTVLLVYEEYGVFEERRVLHDTELGTDSLGMNGKSGREALVKAVREITNLPLKDGNGEGVKYISELVLMGEAAADRQLQEVLRDVLQEQQERLVSSEHHIKTVDPVFAAAQCVAEDCWNRLDFEDVHVHTELR